jgi:hypothetical protein
MHQVQLPPKFQPHPECAAGIITIDQAIFMIKNGWLTLDGAYFLLPPKTWFMLPKPKPLSKSIKRRRWFGWSLKKLRRSLGVST